MSPRLLAGIAADADTQTQTKVYFGTPEWRALCGWLEFHRIDPKRIPAGTRISRDECGRCIRYVRVVDDEHGRPRQHDLDDAYWAGRYVVEATVEQGEAPPLPYPDLIARQLR